eukprot:TRINITY_DN5437_c0_g1_i2.p1 TRINITY_DN5437_c0_g1~~TRINITY_DN5437_c0_g1_i2.p1  ORF type:complete len:175 (-),score=34.23 TRINITY_DN5437_c0_g1_i2:109-585(-)
MNQVKNLLFKAISFLRTNPTRSLQVPPLTFRYPSPVNRPSRVYPRAQPANKEDVAQRIYFPKASRSAGLNASFTFTFSNNQPTLQNIDYSRTPFLPSSAAFQKASEVPKNAAEEKITNIEKYDDVVFNRNWVHETLHKLGTTPCLTRYDTIERRQDWY